MNANDARKAHKLLDYVSQGRAILDDELKLLRSFLPELPTQKTLEELAHNVKDAWVGTEGNEWPDDVHGDLENWLEELHNQLKGLDPSNPTHPEFLETEADYENAPEGTIVAAAKVAPIMKCGRWWESAPYKDCDAKTMADEARRVLRWSWGE